MRKLTSLPLFLILLCEISSSAQIFKTSLTLTVRDELGNIVEGATVQIFEKEEDYLTEKHIIMEGVTDSKGVVKFKKLEGRVYYLLARKGDIDNAGGGELIGPLKEGKFNKATVVIQ